MQKNTLPWIIALVAWTAGSTYWHVCKIKEVCDEPLQKNVSSSNTLSKPTFDIHNEDGLSITTSGNIKFPRSGSSPNVSEVQTQLDQLKEYLAKNPSLQLMLIGKYASTEKNMTQFANLGIARAEEVKQILQIKDGNPHAIVTDGVQNDSLYFEADTLWGGIDVIFKKLPNTNLAISGTEAPPSLTLYFPYAKTDFSHSAVVEEQISKVVEYLHAHPNQQVTLTGYTDNTGSDELNLKLSERRAKTVQDYLIAKGLSTSQFKIVPQGKANPQADNNTEEGRKENRRVVLSF